MINKNAALAGTSASVAASAAGAANANMQADLVNQQIAEAETQKVTILRNISSIQGAIEEIDKKLSGSGGYVNQDASKDNSEIVNIDNQLEIANRRYINNNFRPQDKATVDSLQRIKNRLVASTSGRQSNNSTVIRQTLIGDKIKLENDLASARSAYPLLKGSLARWVPDAV